MTKERRKTDKPNTRTASRLDQAAKVRKWSLQEAVDSWKYIVQRRRNVHACKRLPAAPMMDYAFDRGLLEGGLDLDLLEELVLPKIAEAFYKEITSERPSVANYRFAASVTLETALMGACTWKPGYCVDGNTCVSVQIHEGSGACVLEMHGPQGVYLYSGVAVGYK